jgi:hypothetical protein
MTLNELLQYLDENSKYAVLDGDATETLAKARTGAHREALMGTIIQRLFDAAGGTDISSPITRAEATTALGPLRLQYMKDDAPVEGFRMVERIIHTIDGAFNEEALREREAGR